MPINNDDKALQIAMYPWLALGHLSSFLCLANKLASKGHRVSFFVPTNTQHKLTPHNHHPDLITFIPITVPPSDGLPEGAEIMNDGVRHSGPALYFSMDMTRPAIDSHLALLKPNIIFFDMADWVPELARKYKANSIFHQGSILASFAYLMSLFPRTSFSGAQDQTLEFPSLVIRSLSPQEAPVPQQRSNEDLQMAMFLAQRLETGLRECDAISANTCREMEGPFCDYLEKLCGKPVLLSGPMVANKLPAHETLDKGFENWLKSFGDGNVVFCSLGSECIPEMKQFQELVLGLELTGMPFLVALKPPFGCETIESALPQGFLERVQGKGIVHGGWVQQRHILHHPSVGCFLTHCGAASLWEALVSKCELVMLPIGGMDRLANAKMMALEFGVGIEVVRDENDDIFTKEAICDAIVKVMGSENEEGSGGKANHAKWRQLYLQEGFEEAYVSEFSRSLSGLIG